MPSFTLKLGSLDLAQYLRVTPGEGLDPYDATGFLEPAFAQSPFAEGQPLVTADVQNREMTWPLHLKAATKDAVHALIAQINQEIATNKQLQVEWKDESASNSTFYDVTFARFDPDYNFRRAEHNYESGTLRVFCQPPYGHTGTYRVAGTALSPSSVAFTVPLPSAILGDTPAQTDIRISCGTGFTPEHGRIALVAGLPHASYAFLTPAGSMVVPAGMGIATVVGASGAIGSQSLMIKTNTGENGARVPAFQANLSPASVYAGGRHRVLSLMRLSHPQRSVVMRLNGPDGQPLEGAATAVPSASLNRWHLVDQGVMSVPSTPQTATLTLTALSSGNDVPTYVAFGDLNGAASAAAEINALIVVPEDNFHMAIDSAKRLISVDNFGINDSQFLATIGLAGQYDQLGNAWFAATSFVPNPSMPNASGLVKCPNSGALQAGTIAFVDQFANAIDVPPVFDFKSEQSASIALGPNANEVYLGKLEKGVPTFARYVFGRWTPTNGLSIISGAGGVGSTVLASTARASIAFNNTEFQTGPGGLSYALRFNGSIVASIGVALTNSQRWAGVPLIGLFQAGGGASIAALGAFRAIENPSQAIAAADLVRFAPDGVQVSNSASVFQRDVSAKTRGQPVRLSPSAVAVGVLAIGYDGGPANDILSAEVRVRERFTFAR